MAEPQDSPKGVALLVITIDSQGYPHLAWNNDILKKINDFELDTILVSMVLSGKSVKEGLKTAGVILKPS